MARPTGYRAHLDGIRAIAVVMVILFHLGYRWIPGGFIGVDVFFVVSGYLITGLLLGETSGRGGVRFRRFYARRMRRLLPAAALVLVVVVATSANLLDLLGQQSVGHDVAAAALYFANWHFAFASVGYFTPGDVPSPVVHFWSLAVEEQFYLVWPALFTGLWKLSTRRREASSTGVLLGGIGVLLVVSAVLSVVLVPSNLAYYGTHTRAYQLLAGAALAVVADRFGDRLPVGARARVLGSAGVVASLGVLFLLGHTIAEAEFYPGWNGIAVTAASVALIAALELTPAGLVQRVFGTRPLAGTGRISYSLYLWHWPIIVFAPLLATRWKQGWVDERPTMVVAMTIAALVSYFLVERPIRFSLSPQVSFRYVIGTGLAISVLVALLQIPVLQPTDAFAVKTLAAAQDVAPSGKCPYARESWGAPATSEPCVYRKGGPFVVALVGDSHAQQWQPAFDVIAAKYDLTVIRVTRRGCPINDMLISSLDDQGLSHADVACSEWRHRVYKRLIEEYDPNLIYAETRSQDWSIRVGDRDVAKGDPDHLRLWSDALIPSMKVLTSGTGKVVVGVTTPNMPWRVPSCLAAHGKGTTKCDAPLSSDAEVDPYNAAIRRLPEEVPGVTVVDATPIICPGGTCPAMLDGIIVHRDDDHLSAAFAHHEAAAFERMLRDAGVTFGR